MTSTAAGVLPDWRSVTVPATARTAQTMLMNTELQLLYSLARDYYTGEGCIIDAGCFLGGSTLCFGQGFRDNPRVAWTSSEKPIHSYDLFVIEAWTIGIYFPEGTPLDTTFEPVYRQNIAQFSDLVDVHVGDIMKASHSTMPIEILFIDVAKTIAVGDYVMKEFFPRLIPGKSIVVQQDYLYHHWNGWLHVAMEEYAEYFELLDHTEDNSVVFLYKKQIPAERLKADTVAGMTPARIRALSDQAIARFSGRQKKILEDSANQLQDFLASRAAPAAAAAPAKPATSWLGRLFGK